MHTPDDERLLPEFEDICSVRADSDIECLTVVWKSYVTSAQLRRMHERLLHIIRERKITKILGDDTALPLIHTEDQAWIAQDWLPRAAVIGLKAVANKKPAAHFGRVSVEAVAASQNVVAFQSFDQLEDARRWLKTVEP